jgi:hypothetical protein
MNSPHSEPGARALSMDLRSDEQARGRQEGATQAPVKRITDSTENLKENSSHSEREGEAPTALLKEGATQAPVIGGKK